MTPMHWIFAILALALLAALAYLYAVTWIESRQARQLKSKQPYASATVSAPQTAVVYFSRSGNTVNQRANLTIFQRPILTSGIWDSN